MKNINKLCRLLVMALIVTISIVMLSGCGSKSETDSGSADDSTASGTSNTVYEQPEIDVSSLGGPGGVDVDLTKLSSTMVFAVVNDMVTKPDTYMGKKIRMIGQMTSYQLEGSDKIYHSCLIKDAAACCASGIEFAPSDEYREEDYPGEGEYITVVGTYDRYEEGGYHYVILQDAAFE